MKLKPLYDRVVIKREEEEKTSSGGIILPTAATEKPLQGTVVAVGNGKVKHDKVIPLTVKMGDKVLFAKYGGSEVKVDGVDYIIMREDELLAVLED